MAPKKAKKSRSELEDARQKETAALDEKIVALDAKRQKIIEKYDALIAESDDPSPTTFAYAERNEDNLGNYD